MSGVKRKAPAVSAASVKPKKTKVATKSAKKIIAPPPDEVESESVSDAVSDAIVEQVEDFESFSESEEDLKQDHQEQPAKEAGRAKSKNHKQSPVVQASHSTPSTDTNRSLLNSTNSREAHQKQKVLAAERKAQKPNADAIVRSKKLWERLRLKSHVPKEERDLLVAELFSLIRGHVKDFVFKHDSVRVVQCALKYANAAQRREIAQELKGSYRELAESRYAKFLIAKMLTTGDEVVRDVIVPEFYGNVKRLMRNSEASWIVDDIYRTVAIKEQKARMLREWYGPEFVLFDRTGGQRGAVIPDLARILEASPEKRGPIMRHLQEMTNQLVQKKTTGFTMLHDAMLQYFINTKPGSPEAIEFLELLRDDEGGDCVKNLAFTKSGGRLVCLALAYGGSKERRTLLKFFKTHMRLLSADGWGHIVLLAAFEAVDDTVMLGKSIFGELLGKDITQDELLEQVLHLNARVPCLYLLNKQPPKWLLSEDDLAVLKEVKDIRKDTSKKDPETRRVELLKLTSQPLLDLIAQRSERLLESSFGCQFVTEVLFGAIGDKDAAVRAIADLAKPQMEVDLNTAHAGRVLKALVQGGPFDRTTKVIKTVEPALNFHNVLYDVLGPDFWDVVKSWAFSGNSFIVVAMLEADGFEHRADLVHHLKDMMNDLASSKSVQESVANPNAGTKMILEKIGAGHA